VTDVLNESGLVVQSLGPHKHCDASRLLMPVGVNRSRLPMYRVRSLLGRYPRRPFVFCFVRHPLSWYESWFKYMSQPALEWRSWGGNKRSSWHPNAPLDGLGSPNFNQFVTNVCDRCPGYVSEMYDSYTQSPTSFVGRTERLREDLLDALSRAGLDQAAESVLAEKPPARVSPKPTETLDWDPAVRARVLELERPSLEKYGFRDDPRATLVEGAQ
jgi:hypothetical protein